MAKNYSRSIRMTDEVRKYVEKFSGEGFNEKFENLVIFCMREEKELEKRIATIHAQAVTLHIEKLSCPKEQKLKLYDAIKEAHHLQR